VFVTSEPDELICIDKNTGKLLWSATNNYYDATPRRNAMSAPRSKNEWNRWRSNRDEKDAAKRWRPARSSMMLCRSDKEKYTIHFDGHLRGTLTLSDSRTRRAMANGCTSERHWGGRLLRA